MGLSQVLLELKKREGLNKPQEAEFPQKLNHRSQRLQEIAEDQKPGTSVIWSWVGG